MEEYIDKIDLRARNRSAEAIKKVFLELVDQIKRGEEPRLVIKKRSLDNTIYDSERKMLRLGKRTAVRRLLDEGEVKKFMQTVLMASIVYDALINNEYPTIRDLYYRGKHTIPKLSESDREINTWDEQDESDSVLRDIEVLTNRLREEMLILSKEKGKVVGNMRIMSGRDRIDLSRMGHGAYAIESTADLIEFLDVDAEYVLVVEKDAVFQQLHRIGFWRKARCLLVTSAGQPDRATRRFVRRLNEELKLPVYVITDSDPYGFYIYSVFKIGSITLSYESERLATPHARFLGVMMSDVFGDDPPSDEFQSVILGNSVDKRALKKRYLDILKKFGYKGDLDKKPFLSEEERKMFIIRAKQQDVARAIELVGTSIARDILGFEPKVMVKGRGERVKRHPGYPWFKSPKWIKEVSIFLYTLAKLEIEAMASKGLKFLAFEYLPSKIETGDFID